MPYKCVCARSELKCALLALILHSLRYTFQYGIAEFSSAIFIIVPEYEILFLIFCLHFVVILSMYYIFQIDMLPEIVEAVRNTGVEVYVDGGVRMGTDVLKALALGARAVFVGRPIIWGLAHNVSSSL